ncbi:MAG: FecR family protein [Pseudomonadota bacterium]|nr:FecR family protein [Pseudomonadota bacterium]
MKYKPIFFLLFAALLTWLAPGASFARKPLAVKAGKGGAVVTHLDGQAQVLPQGEKAWRMLAEKANLRGGDEVVVGGNSRLEITLADNSRLRFAAESRFIVERDGADKGGDVKVHIAVGRTWANVSKSMGLKRKFEISCNNAVTGVRGTIYRLNAHSDASALVRVYEGEIAVTGVTKAAESGRTLGPPVKIPGPRKIAGPHKVSREEWTVIVRSMQQVYIRADGSADKPRTFSVEEDRDAWVDWNRSRDRAL